MWFLLQFTIWIEILDSGDIEDLINSTNMVMKRINILLAVQFYSLTKVTKFNIS